MLMWFHLDQNQNMWTPDIHGYMCYSHNIKKTKVSRVCSVGLWPLEANKLLFNNIMTAKIS